MEEYTCETCRWYAEFEGVCCNSGSPYRGGWPNGMTRRAGVINGKNRKGEQSKMFIIYYRNKEGKITRHHGNRGNCTLGELKELEAGYNADSGRTGETVHVVEVEEDSLTAYLFQKEEDRISKNKDLLRAVVDNLEYDIQYVQELGG